MTTNTPLPRGRGWLTRPPFHQPPAASARNGRVILTRLLRQQDEKQQGAHALREICFTGGRRTMGTPFCTQKNLYNILMIIF